MKQIVIVKDKTSTIKVFKTYIEIITDYENRIIGIQNIGTLYLDEKINQPKNLHKLAKELNIYIINNDGTILGKVDAKI